MTSKESVQKLIQEVKRIQICESTPDGTVLSGKVDPVLKAKWPKLKNSKVPAVFLHQPADFLKYVEKVVRQNIKIYPYNNGMYFTKIMCATHYDHKALVQFFDKNQLPYHTFGHPSKSKMKVVFKGLPLDVDLNKLMKELKAVSIPVIRVHKMHTKERPDAKMLVLVVVPNDINRDRILRVTKLLGYVVTLEPPKEKPKQCYRCQKWGHSQRFCHGQLKCVKCAGDHSYKKCNKTGTVDPPKCANCGEDHTANYKNCKMSPYNDGFQTYMALKMMSQKLRSATVSDKKVISIEQVDTILNRKD